MPDRYVSRGELAVRLGLSERQITNLVRRHPDFPSRVDGRERSFPTDRCFEWYVRYKQEEALQRAAAKPEITGRADADLRKAIADAEIAELRVQKLRGDVVPTEAYRKELRRVLDRVRGRFVSIPGEYGPRCLNLSEVAASVAVLRDLVASVLAELQSVANAPDLDEDATEESAA